MEELTYEKFINNILEIRGRFNCGEEYHERHHIVPKCCGGGNEEENLIDLFAQEHYEAHRLMAIENPENCGLQYAWWNMYQCKRDGRQYEVSAEEYAKLRQRLATIQSENEVSEETRKKMSETRQGMHHSRETKRKISEAMKGKNKLYGKHHTEESKRKLSEANKGKHRSEETKKKMSETKAGVKHPRAKSVTQYDLDGNLIRVWDFIRQVEKELCIAQSGISNCCEGKRKTAGGFIWRYTTENKTK